MLPVTRYPTKPHNDPLKTKKANGRVVVVAGRTKVMKHEAYSKRPLSASPLVYKLPTEGYR